MNPHRAHYSSNQMFDNLKATEVIPEGAKKWNRWVRVTTAIVTAGVAYYWIFRKDFGESDHVFVPVHRWHDNLLTSLGFTPPSRTPSSDVSFGIFGKRTRMNPANAVTEVDPADVADSPNVTVSAADSNDSTTTIPTKQ